jgi:hypothetical protein
MCGVLLAVDAEHATSSPRLAAREYRCASVDHQPEYGMLLSEHRLCYSPLPRL